MARRTDRCLAALLMALLPMAASAADLVLRNAAVYTLNDKQPWATALVIHDGRIAYVGDEAGLKPYLSGAHVIDLHGEMVLPGFHDAHIHPMSGAMRLVLCKLGDAKSVQELDAGIRTEAATQNPWVFCNAVPAALGAALNRAKLDALVPDRPAFVRTYDGFTGWTNSRALRAAGIDPDGTGPEVKGLVRDPKTHKPTGLLNGDATSLVRNKVPPPTQAQYREALRRASTIANGFGITSLFDAAATPELLDAYHAADLAGELTVRVVAAQRVDTGRGPEQVDEFIKARDRVQGKRFRADAAKIFLDEEIVEHTGAMLAPYTDAPKERGELLAQPAAVDALVQRLDAAGFLIHMHAMGDRTVRVGLDAYEHAIQVNGPQDRRHQIAHDGVVDPADIPRFGKLGVTANFSPLWFDPDDEAYASTVTAVGPERAKWIYPMASVAAAGGRIVASSDWPQPTMSPLDGIQFAVTRQPLDGSKPSPQPEQRISLVQALAAYTRDAAWVVREDKLDGTLEAGKAADIVVLDRNLFKIDVMSIHKTRVLLTLLDGEPVYQDPKVASP
jgi:predicted amidohydrolase YtcJ